MSHRRADCAARENDSANSEQLRLSPWTYRLPRWQADHAVIPKGGTSHVRHGTARVRYAAWWRGGGVAGCGARQQSALPVIGFLHSATSNSYAPMTAAFHKSLNEAGYIEGQNVTIEYRWAEINLTACQHWRLT